MGDSSLVAAASSILQESDAFNKKALTDRIVSDWSHGLLAACSPDADDPSAPDQPSRDGRVKIVAPKDIPKLGKAGTLASRQVRTPLAEQLPRGASI